MDKQRQRIERILRQRHWSAEDARWMDGYLRQADHRVLEDVARSLYDADVSQGSEGLHQGLSRQMLEHIHRRIGVRKPNRLVRLLKSMPYVAAALLFVAVGVWFAVSLWQSGASTGMPDIAPGGNRATLTLADGRVINLDEAQTGIIIGAEDITYQDGSSLTAVIPDLSGQGVSEVEPSLHNPGNAPAILSLTTPKGGTYQVTLPDGSRVWLNAASTLKYPSRFSADAREVFLEGEAFFQIQPQVGRVEPVPTRREAQYLAPFNVQTANQVVNVLGTAFNLSAYPDEDATKTTLVTGRVRVVGAQGVGANPEGLVEDNKHSPDKVGVVLTPGQQATNREAAITVHDVDTEPFTAWRDGLIILDHADLAQVIRQIERWYDVTFDIVEVPAMGTLSGEIPRSVNLSEVLRVLELNTGLPFEINGRRVTMAN